jgi:hypothetical protein
MFSGATIIPMAINSEPHLKKKNKKHLIAAWS